MLGHADRLAWFATPLPHGLSHDMRMQIYNWFGRWLKGETRPIVEEPETTPERDETLNVSDSGSMVKSFHGATPYTLNRDYAIRKTPLKSLDELLGVDPSCCAWRHDRRSRIVSQHRDRSGRIRVRPEGLGACLAVPAEEERSPRSR